MPSENRTSVQSPIKLNKKNDEAAYGILMKITSGLALMYRILPELSSILLNESTNQDVSGPRYEFRSNIQALVKQNKFMATPA